MDEPFGSLDEIVRDHLNEQLLALWAKTGKTVIFVTHSIPEAVFLSTRIVVMSPRPGRIHDVIDVGLPANRALDIRETPEFLRLAARVRQGLEDLPGIRFPHPTEINFVLVALPKPVWDGLVADGYSFSRRGAPRDGIVRIACAWDTPSEAVDALIEAAHRHAGLLPADATAGRRG